MGLLPAILFKRQQTNLPATFTPQFLQMQFEKVDSVGKICKTVVADITSTQQVLRSAKGSLEEKTHAVFDEWRDDFQMAEEEILEAAKARATKLDEYDQIFEDLRKDILGVGLGMHTASLDLRIYAKLVEAKANVTTVVEACGDVAGVLVKVDDALQGKIQNAVETINRLQERLTELRSRNLQITSGISQLALDKLTDKVQPITLGLESV